MWLFASTHCNPVITVIALYHLNSNGKLLKFLRILITSVYFNNWNWTSKTVYFISCSVVCKKIFCSEFPDIPNKTGRNKKKEKKKNTCNCKALCFSRKCKNYFVKYDILFFVCIVVSFEAVKYFIIKVLYNCIYTEFAEAEGWGGVQSLAFALTLKH